jgi:hypothetical protein
MKSKHLFNKQKKVMENEQICKNCGESIWLHPELDFDGLVGNGCSDFELEDQAQSPLKS